MSPTKRKWKIILAEDNPGDVFLVRRALDFHGLDYELSVAKDGEQALSLVQRADNGEAAMDLILVDLNLPRHDGGQIVAAARASKTLEKTPIILLTSSDSPHDRGRLTKLGADIYFRKPTDLASFMEIGKLVKDIITHSQGGRLSND
jgi:chemotaxis family two-component system response regulator Rcp1